MLIKTSRKNVNLNSSNLLTNRPQTAPCWEKDSLLSPQTICPQLSLSKFQCGRFYLHHLGLGCLLLLLPYHGLHSVVSLVALSSFNLTACPDHRHLFLPETCRMSSTLLLCRIHSLVLLSLMSPKHYTTTHATSRAEFSQAALRAAKSGTWRVRAGLSLPDIWPRLWLFSCSVWW